MRFYHYVIICIIIIIRHIVTNLNYLKPVSWCIAPEGEGKVKHNIWGDFSTGERQRPQDMPCGGHSAAREDPDILFSDLRLESRRKNHASRLKYNIITKNNK
jgi:hypothetical protein